MSNNTIIVAKREVPAPEGVISLMLTREDLTKYYPGMYRYCLAATSGTHPVRVFRTNTYEYSPGCPLDAETVCKNRMDTWEQELKENAAGFRESAQCHSSRIPPLPASDVVVIQGSPRGDGNCSIITGWVADFTRDLGKTVQVIYPDDLGIHPCIGCYQCYNDGACTFTDDMEEVIQAISHASLIVVCSPVYTNTVPGALKILIDRCLAWHAARTMGQGKNGQKGILVAVAGRTGQSNFRCVTAVVNVFMENLGITCTGELLLDRMDYEHDVRTIPGIRERLSETIRNAFM
jgi:multimeric flavodoxin WrbA